MVLPRFCSGTISAGGSRRLRRIERADRQHHQPNDQEARVIGREGGGEIGERQHRERDREQGAALDPAVSHAVTGEPIQSTIAPKVINSPAVRMLTSSPEDSSPSMPAGASTEQPVTMLPSINAVGAKRRSTAAAYACRLRLLMQLHLIACPMIAFAP